MTTFAHRWNLDKQLLVAIQNNDVPRAHKLFQEGVDTDTRFCINSQQRPALCLCVENNAQDMVKLFVELGASINQGDSQGVTALHVACHHAYVHLASMLIKARANVNARTDQGNTPLHLAAMRGNKDLVELLLSNRANVDLRDRVNRTPLHYAAASANPEVVELLLSYKSDPSLVDVLGNTPLHYASDLNGMPPHVVKRLATAYPPAVGITNRNTETPIHIAVRSGRCDAEDVLKAVLESGTKKALNAKSSLGHTPLHLAVLDHRINLMRVLLTAGANTDTEDDLRHTPIGSAARDAKWGAVALLLAAGARTQCLIQGGSIESEIKDSGIHALIEDATKQPPRLSSVCRRALTHRLGPAALRVLSSTTLPQVWWDFLTYQTINL